MIQEDYVSFETAKLLKEKGFPQELGEVKNILPYYMDNGFINNTDIGTGLQRCYCAAVAPSLSITMKWLREVYDIHIVPRKDFFNGTYTGMIYDGRRENVFDKDDYIALVGYETYEEACNDAIKYCLTKLI